jgi:hypothetical protein
VDQVNNQENAYQTAKNNMEAPKVHTVGSTLKADYKSFSAQPFKHRAAVAGIVGGTLGLISSDQKRDSVISTIMDAGIGAGAAIGVESATNYIIKNHGDQIKEFFSSAKNISTGDMSKITGEIDTANMIDEAKLAKMNRAFGRGGAAIKGIGVFIGATALLGVSQKLGRNADVQRMQNDAEAAMVKKDKQESKIINELFAYNKHQPMGQLVMDMWDDRIGHHKMGNSKFQ